MMIGPRTLIVESDDKERAFLQETLEDAEHATTAAATAADALDRLRDVPFDLVITALELDDELTGLRVARALKWRWPKTSVIIAAENGSFDSAKAAIDLGVDGYLLKPIETAELRETVQRALERQQARCCVDELSQVLRWRGLAVNKQKGRVTLEGEPIDLTPTEFKLLLYLLENGHRVVSPEELFEASHSHPPEDRDSADDAIRWHIYNLRRKIEPHPRTPVYILNVYGLGYTFAGPEGVGET